MRLAIIDLAYGNIGSIQLAFQRLGIDPVVTADPDELAASDRVVLPGVGAAGHAMERVDALGLRGPLKALKQPGLGICLGMQLLFEHSEEADTECLGIIPGSVRAIEPAPDRPVPHVGWSSLEVRDETIGLRTGDYVYFAHGYAVAAGPSTVATASYGANIPAVVRQGNWLGAQFHPERSADAGSRFLTAFLQ